MEFKITEHFSTSAEKLQELNLNYPSVVDKEIVEMKEAKKILENEEIR
jgi:hypothetical protein